MNERIKQLAEQAGFQYIKDEGIGWAGNYNASLSKFAELIVRECISKIEEAAEYSPELYGVALDLQEHFGIEK